jgi:hypothetical protein
MKRFIVAALFPALFALGSPLFAQKVSAENSSEYYYENISLEKVYPTKFGYVLQHRKGVNGMARIYVPNEWFTDAGGKAELVSLPPGKTWPSLTVFYEKGEFSHIRLYVHPSRAHITWGNVPLPINSQLGQYFENVETIKIER